MNFKAKHNKSFYKSTDAWLNAVYRNNKEFIDKSVINDRINRSRGEFIPPSTSIKTQFKNEVKRRIREGSRPTTALKEVGNTTVFKPVKERLRENALKAIKADKAVYKQFREQTKVGGKYTKMDPNKLKWDAYNQMYTYEDSYSVQFVRVKVDRQTETRIVLKKI